MEPHAVYQYDSTDLSSHLPGKSGVSNNQFFIMAEQPVYRKATVVLSKTIKLYIRQFLASSKIPGNDVGEVGGQQWTCALTNYLHGQDSRISLDDVERWKKTHYWITSTSISSGPKSTQNATVTSSQSQSADMPVLIRRLGNTKPSSSSVTSLPEKSVSIIGPSDDGTTTTSSSAEDKKCFDECADIVMKLRQKFEERPELRAGLAHLDPLANLLTRNIKKVMTKNTRVNILHKQLRDGGIRQYVKGFKKEFISEDGVTPNDHDDISVDEIDEIP